MRSLISSQLEDRLNELQMELVQKEVPVLIVFEGGSGRVISRVVNEISRSLEPRSVSYSHFDALEYGPSALSKILSATPAKGEVALFDRSWYSMYLERYNGVKAELVEDMKTINAFEEYLMDNGTFIVKIALDVTPGTMARYANDYRPYTPLSGTFLSVDRVDRVKYYAVGEELVRGTDTDRAPWDIVEVGDTAKTVEAVAKVIIDRFSGCLRDDGWRKPAKHRIAERYPNPRKGLDPNGDAKGAKEKMEKLSEELERLQILLAYSGRSLIVAFEGWDAAGKGGCIKHLTHALNPRGYVVDRVKKPTEEANAHTYMWRFAPYMPRPGHIAIFDRTWYGRMMVEPIEGFCTPEEYSRSADEINLMEGILRGSGAMIVKFWLEISKDEQESRFKDRQKNHLKSWKLTDEDWRNREKWDIYEGYIDRMIASTSTDAAPWIAVPANNKKAAHLQVLSAVVDVLKKNLEPRYNRQSTSSNFDNIK